MALLKLCFFIALALPLFSQSVSQPTVVGLIVYPDHSSVNGTLSIALAATSLQNTCTSPVTPMSFATMVTPIINSSINPVQLFPTACLKPTNPYQVTAYDRQRNLLFQSTWRVPLIAAVTPDIAYVDSGSAIPFSDAALYADLTTSQAGLTRLIAGTPGYRVRLYSLFFLISQSYAPTDFKLVSATGCQSNQHDIIPQRPGAPNIGQTYVQYNYANPIIETSPGDDICLYLSASPLKAYVQVLYQVLP